MDSHQSAEENISLHISECSCLVATHPVMVKNQDVRTWAFSSVKAWRPGNLKGQGLPAKGAGMEQTGDIRKRNCMWERGDQRDGKWASIAVDIPPCIPIRSQ